MRDRLPDLSNDQWDFLSILHAFGEPVSVDIAGILAPIAPGRFLDLLGRDEKPRYVSKDENGNYFISPEWLSKLDGRLKEINTQKRLNELFDRLYSHPMMDQVDFAVLNNLIAKLEQNPLSAEMELNLAQMILEKRDESAALDMTISLVRRLSSVSEKPEIGQLFIRSVLMVSPLWFFSGENLKEIIAYIKKAIRISMNTGDKRSQAILNLTLSSYYELIGKNEDMWSAFSAGYQGVKDLGDSDILIRTAPLLATNLILQGLYKEAEPHFERGLPSIIINQASAGASPRSNPQDIFQYGTCLIFLGKIVEAVGFLQFCLRRTREESNHYGELFTLNLLAVALLAIHRIRPAIDIIEGTLGETKGGDYALIRYLLYFNLSYAHFLDNDFDKALKMIKQASAIGEKLGTIRFPMAGYILEMLFELNRLGYPPVPRFHFNDQLEQIRKGNNVDLKGTVMRLEAMALQHGGNEIDSIEKSLISSQKYHEQSGNTIQLGKTYLERTRVYLKKNDGANAALYAKKADDCFGEYTRYFFPGDLKGLLNYEEQSGNAETDYQRQLGHMLDGYDAVSTSEDAKEVFFRCFRSICRMSGTERAGLFRFDKNGKPKDSHDAVLYNITRKEIKSRGFSPGTALIKKALKTQAPCFERRSNRENVNDLFEIRSRCCVPIEIDNGQQCVIYLDNMFFDERYEELPSSAISKLVRKAETRVRQLSDNRKYEGPAACLDRGQSLEILNPDDLKTENPAMLALIEKADKIASSESAVLITGETGTGKELLSQRIHEHSPRKNKPFVVVDLTAIPESLLESELFGHEKGAFTGADRQKMGRIEHAHLGTLFLDEIGEIPLAFQVKLLRLLQEKSITRIGGAKTIPVDFRLIAATNRNLEEEVAAGRFRQDLYYRLNVVPITLPPLRERFHDIIVLAQHFLAEFKKRIHKPDIRLTPEDKAWLMNYDWPGNIRELKNIIERSVILSTNGLLNLSMMPSPASISQQASRDANHPSTGPGGTAIPVGDYPTLEEVQRRYFKLVLEKTNGKMTGTRGAADIVGMKPSSMYNRMRKLGLR